MLFPPGIENTGNNALQVVRNLVRILGARGGHSTGISPVFPRLYLFTGNIRRAHLLRPVVVHPFAGRYIILRPV